VPDDGRTFPLLAAGVELAYEREYRTWLSVNATKRRPLGERSLSDVVSRTKRAAGLGDILAPGTDAEIIFRLTQDPRFEALTTNVKSQLKRAVTLYRKFYRERRSS
jgi:hypothetical protein